MKKKNIFKYSTLFIILGIVLVFIVVVSTSYAFFTTTIKGKELVIKTGTLAVNYLKKTDVINLTNLYPTTNSEGLNQTAHEFSITNNGNITARYQIRLEIDNNDKNQVPIEYIKMSYKKDDNSYTTPVLLSDLNSSLVLLKDIVIEPQEVNNYGIKLWIDLSAPNDIQNKTFKAKVVVDSIQDVEDGYVINTIPIINLNKDKNNNTDINLKVGETYTELGVESVEDDTDILTVNQVTKTYEYFDGANLTTVDKVDTSKTGIYYVTYSVTDSDNNTGKITRIITVNNTSTIPSITLNGDATITLQETEEYNELRVTVQDNNKVITIGEVKIDTVGTYIVRYIVIDKSNNLNSITRTVNVVRKQVVITYDYNYLENNAFEDLYDTTHPIINVADGLIYQKEIDENGVTHIATVPANVNNTSNFAGFYFPGIDIPLTSGIIYTMTFEARGNENFTALIGSEQDGYKKFNITPEWKRYNHTFVASSRDPESISKVAFVFYGWVSIESDRTIEVRNIFFQEGENTSLKSCNLLWGDPIKETYEIPIREGYEFIGWYTDPIYGTKIEEDSLVPYNDTTYYAHWKYIAS